MISIDLTQMPFSMAGSYLAISALNRERKEKGGLYLNNVHGASASCRMVCRLAPLSPSGEEIPFEAQASESQLVIRTGEGCVRFCFENPKALLIQGEHASLALKELSSGKGYDYAFLLRQQEGERVYLLNCDKNQCRYLLHLYQGKERLEQDWDGQRTTSCDFFLQESDGGFFACLEELDDGGMPQQICCDYEAARQQREQEFLDYCAAMPSVPQQWEDTRRLAAYLTWSSTVAPFGLLKRPGIFMSKNWMTNVWSWDHCFNAMALAEHRPKDAWDQWLLPFDFQGENGAIPDYVNDMRACWNFCKLPIHGWALAKMREVMELSREQKETAYQKLSAWTQWWFCCRDQDRDGICEYHHGNDSGWDNSTLFRESPLVEAPDLSAFLVLQMEQLSRLACELGREQEGAEWSRRAGELLEKMDGHFFQEDGSVVARHSGSHQAIFTDSLQLCLPVILGNRLPQKMKDWLVSRLKEPRFSGGWGFATEADDSPFYQPDGYWRGPVWAPSTMILIDGLRQCGEGEFADQMAEKFCQMVASSGFAENFDPHTGEGLRDRAYTWTSGVFLLLARQLRERDHTTQNTDQSEV